MKTDGDLGELGYDEWLEYVFNHAITDPKWHFEISAPYWDPDRDPAVTVEYLTRLFREAGDLRDRYTDAQLNQGFWFLASNSCSDHMHALKDGRVPIAERVRCIEAVYDTYRDLFAPACGNELSAYAWPAPEEPLCGACYMWWDLVPIHPVSRAPEDTALDDAILRTMVRTLALESEACCEGALHGLGHWKMYYPDLVKAAIAEWMRARPNISRRLREYALEASRGHVL